MAVTISGTDGIVGAGFTVDASGISVTAGVVTATSINAGASGLTGALPALNAASLTSIPAANIVGVCTSGLTKTGGFGKILQFVSSKKTNVQSTSSTSFVDVTQMSCTITPTASDSKILVDVSIGMNKNNYTTLYQVLRDSTLVGQPDAGSGYGSFNVYTADNPGHWRANWRYDDSPGDTSSHTYKLQVKSDGGTDPEIWINGHHGNSSTYTTTSYMSLIEIAA
tara:strand:+ start:577 stop:1248 length:672 start_codon:yes stop_codon:yes gene_type:complete